MPDCVVIPELAYPQVREAVQWLCAAFGFHERLRIADHRAQLVLGGGCVVVTGPRMPGGTISPQAVLVRIDDVDGHFTRATGQGATVLNAPVSQPYGERQYVVSDPAGHVWTFSQTIADVDPAHWGGALA